MPIFRNIDVNSRPLTELEKTLKSRMNQDLSVLSSHEQAQIVTRRAEIIQPIDELESRLAESQRTGKPLELKMGIDPTGPEIHLGHAVPMTVANIFQRMGHNLKLVIGDITASIGDPSGRSEERPLLSPKQIDDNQQSYLRQASPFIDTNRAQVVRNSKWLGNMSAQEASAVASKISFNRLVDRESLSDRIQRGKPVGLNETIYAFVMGLDSRELHADIEIGGVDQLTNMEICQDVQRASGQRPEVIVNTPILIGTDGSTSKMSKSKKNYIAAQAEPNEMFTQLSNIPDSDGVTQYGRVKKYFNAFTDITPGEWQEVEGRLAAGKIKSSEVKETLAHIVTEIVHGEDAANKALDRYKKRISFNW